MVDMSVISYCTGLKEGIVQIEHLLPKLPYLSLGEALWSLRELPLNDEDTLVSWILEYCQPVQVCWSYIDIEYPDVEGYLTQQGEGGSVQPGEIIVLVYQDFPSEDGVYVYVGEGKPLIRKGEQHDNPKSISRLQ